MAGDAAACTSALAEGACPSFHVHKAKGYTPLHAAAEGGHAAALSAILAHGEGTGEDFDEALKPQVNIKSTVDLNTPLILATTAVASKASPRCRAASM